MTTTDRDVTMVIGGSGFLGSHASRALADKGHDVDVVDLRPPEGHAAFVLDGRARFHQASVEDQARLTELMDAQRPRWVIHAAAIAQPERTRDDPMLAARVNLLGALNVFEAAARAAVERLVFISSIGVLPADIREPITPDHPLVTARNGPASGYYGASKGGAEMFGLVYAESGRLDVRIVRPSALYGLGMAQDLYVRDAVEGAVQQRPIHYDHGATTRRDYTHVKDAVSLILALLETETVEDRVFFAATGRPLLQAREVINHVRTLVPSAVLRIDDVMTERDRAEQGFRGVLDVSNAERELGWSPRYSIESGLEEYIDSFRQYMTWSRQREGQDKSEK